MYLDCSLVIIVIKAIQPDCDKIKGSSVLLLETPLTRSKYISPYTHAQHLTRTSRTFYTFAYKVTLHPSPEQTPPRTRHPPGTGTPRKLTPAYSP